MFNEVDRYLKSAPKPVIVLFFIFIIVILGYVDHLIAPRISLTVFYALPVAGSAWYLNRKAGLIMSFLAAVTWLTADLAAGHTYIHYLVPFWNSVVRLIFFMTIALLLSIIRQKLDIEESLADTDYLTGLKNSRSFYEHLEAESNRSKRSLKPFTIVYIDLDNFKYVNDNMGHDAGDELLIYVADKLRENVRLSDMASRLGGDEFAILFPETDYEKAGVVIKSTVQKLSTAMNDKNLPVTFSIGAITFNKPLHSTRDMIKAADDTMYEVKRKSKNNVVHKIIE